MVDTTSKHLFVSYTSSDAAVAGDVASMLRAGGHKVTIQAVDFRPGSNFVVAMQDALNAADHVIAVLSPAYEQSAFATTEWAAAFAQDPLGRERRLIGVRVVDYRPTGLLRAVVHVDIVGKDSETAQSDLLDAILPGSPGAGTSERGIRAEAVIRPLVHRLPLFSGREAGLVELGSYLGKSRARIAITGLGGVGKTSLAAELAYQVGDAFDTLMWLYAPDKQTALEGVTEAALRAGIVALDTTPQAALVALNRMFSESNRALLVLDDCPAPQLITELFRDSPSHIVATSRHDRGWSTVGITQHRLEPWSHVESVEYLEAAAPTGAPGGEMVAAALDGLPLALAQAAAYVDTHGISFAAYIERLSEHAGRLFDTPPGEHYGYTVLDVWTMSLDDLAEHHPASYDLLKVLALADKEDFPRACLELGHSAFEGPLSHVSADPFELDIAIARLLEQSLCTAHGDGLSVHPIVQGVITSRLPADEMQGTLGSLVAALHLSIPDGATARSRGTWERLSPHIAAAVRTTLQLDVYADDLRPLAAAYAYATARFGYPHFAAYLMGEVVRYLGAHREETDAYEVVNAAHDLGSVLLQLRAADDAVGLFRYVVDADRAAGALTTSRSIDSQVGLASALTDTGAHDEALSVISSAVEHVQATGTPDDKLKAMVYGTWGRLLLRLGQPAEGRVHLASALAHSESACQRQDVALTHLHLGNSWALEGRVEKATGHYTEALRALDELHGEEDLRANILASLASTATRQGEFNDALDHTDEALRCLADVPEGDYSVTAALLHFQRAQLWGRLSLASLPEIVVEAGKALDVLCDHLPAGHPHRKQVASFLVWIADNIDDQALRARAIEREPTAASSTDD